jgi:hypothetical protein
VSQDPRDFLSDGKSGAWGSDGVDEMAGGAARSGKYGWLGLTGDTKVMRERTRGGRGRGCERDASVADGLRSRERLSNTRRD